MKPENLSFRPKENAFANRFYTGNDRDISVHQGTAGSGQQDLTSDKIHALINKGFILVMLMEVFLEGVRDAKSAIYSKTMGLKEISQNSATLQKQRAALISLHSWLEAAKSKDAPLPDISDLYAAIYKDKQKNKKEADLIALRPEIADALNDPKYKNLSSFRDLNIMQVVTFKNQKDRWVNECDALKNRYQESINPVMSIVQSYESILIKVMDLMKSIQNALARFR